MAVAISHQLAALPFTTYSSMELTSRGFSGQRFGRYQDQKDDKNDDGEKAPSSVSLEALVAFLGQSPNEDFHGNGESSPPLRSHGFNSLRSESDTYRKTHSFPKVTKGSVQSPSRAPSRRTVRSRSVRFADSQGLPLERIRSLTAADPFQTEGEIVPLLSNDLGAIAKETKLLPRKLKFSQPGTRPDFYQRLQSLKVCLESVRCETRAVQGIVRTLNLCYEKHVIIRWTTNQWKTHNDTACIYCTGSSDGYTDRFSFILPTSENNLEFAVCFYGQGTEYWDNNQNSNYVITLK